CTGHGKVLNRARGQITDPYLVLTDAAHTRPGERGRHAADNARGPDQRRHGHLEVERAAPDAAQSARPPAVAVARDEGRRWCPGGAGHGEVLYLARGQVADVNLVLRRACDLAPGKGGHNVPDTIARPRRNRQGDGEIGWTAPGADSAAAEK